MNQNSRRSWRGKIGIEGLFLRRDRSRFVDFPYILRLEVFQESKESRKKVLPIRSSNWQTLFLPLSPPIGNIPLTKCVNAPTSFEPSYSVGAPCASSPAVRCHER